MKTSRFRQSYRQSASSFHKAVGEILTSEFPFKNYRAYQEYPVNKINPEFSDGRCHFDWVILDLKLIVECHGEQHDRPVDFGGEGQEKALEHFMDTVHRDKLKKQTALDAGYTYISLSWKERKQLSANHIWQRYLECYNPDKTEVKTSDHNARARQYRKQQYKKRKELAKEVK